MKRAIIMLLLLTSLASGVDAKTYKVGLVHWAGFSPANVADVKGLWKAAGLDVRVFMFNSNNDVHNALTEKRIDIAVDIHGFWVDFVMQGVPITILAEIDWSYGGDKIIAKKGLDPASLKGQIIGTYDASSATLPLIHHYLQAYGLNVADAKRVEFAAEDLPKKFLTTKMSLVVCYDPFALAIEQSGMGEVVATSATYPGSIADSIAMRTDVLQSTPREDVLKFLTGWIEAVKWLHDDANWKEYAAILNEQTFSGETPLSDEELRGILAGVQIHDVPQLRAQHQPNGGLVVYLKELRTMLAENNLLTADFTPEALVDVSFINEVLAQQP